VIDEWFATEVLVHEDALVRYLRRMWPREDDILDFRQEAYVRVYEAAEKALPQFPKAFLFTTARNLIFDRARREGIVQIDSVGEIDTLDVLVNEVSAERQASASQELRRLAAALDQLPQQCRQVVWMRRVEELPQKEVAQRLGISEKSVEKLMAKAVRLMADNLFGS
jgi:RNA polymerase sigma factor (sigma-70 family)